MRVRQVILLIMLLLGAGASAQTSVQIPNIFTPDGDGKNDRFHIFSSGYAELSCAIYNRYGEVLYRFYGLDGSWDGFTHSGAKVDPGVYFVILELVDTNGNEETRQGTLQVLWR